MIQTGAVLYKPTNVVPDDPRERKSWMEQWSNFMAWSAYRCFDYDIDILPVMYAHGRIPESEMSHITDMFVKDGNNANNLKRVLPAVMGDFNYIITLINKQLGRALSNDIVFTASVADESAVIEKLQQVSDKAADMLTRMARQAAGIHQQIGEPIVKGDDVEKVNPEKLKDMSFASELLDSEIAVSKAMQWLMGDKSLFLQHKLVHEILFGYLCTGKMGGEVYIIDGKPDIIPIPSGQMIYDLNSYSPFVHQGDMAGHWFYATPQEIAVICPKLTRPQVKEIEERVRAFGAGTLNPPLMPGTEWWYDRGQPSQGQLLGVPARTIVFRNYWKGIKMVKAKVTPNLLDKDNPHIEYLKEGEDPILDEEAGEYIDTLPKNTLYKSTRISDLFFYETVEVEGEEDLPIVGFIDQSPSLVRIVMHCQRLIAEVLYTMERLAGQTKGNILWLDKANPDESAENLYSMLGFGIGYYDSSKEGTYQNFNNQQGGSIPKQTDMGMSSAVGDMMRLFQMLRGIMMDLVGSNEAANGVIKSDQTLGATKNSTVQAQLSMQPTFDKWYTTVEMFGQALCDKLKSAWSGQERHLQIMGLKGSEYFRIKPEDFDPETKHIIRIGNSVRSDEIKQMILGMAEKILPIAKDPDMALTIIKLANASSGAEAEQIFTKGIESMNKLKQEENQRAQSMQQSAAASAQQLEETKLKKTMLELQNDKEIAAMKIASTERIEADKLTHKADEQDVAHDQAIKEKIFDEILQNQKK